MKCNLKKILSLFLILSIVLTSVNINVRAESESDAVTISGIYEGDQTISGTGRPEANIQVSFSGTTLDTGVGSDGKWEVDIPEGVTLTADTEVSVTQTSQIDPEGDITVKNLSRDSALTRIGDVLEYTCSIWFEEDSDIELEDLYYQHTFTNEQIMMEVIVNTPAEGEKGDVPVLYKNGAAVSPTEYEYKYDSEAQTVELKVDRLVSGDKYEFVYCVKLVSGFNSTVTGTAGMDISPHRATRTTTVLSREAEETFVSKTVRKVWDDNDNENGKRPESIKVQLYKTADETTEAITGEEIVLDESNSWQYTWTDLAEKESGKDITYSVKEVEVPEDYTVSYSDDTFIITNEEIITANLNSVEVTKYVMYKDQLRSVNYTFYAALFWDEACTRRATEVKELTLENSYAATAVFDQLAAGTYYLAETDGEGNVLNTDDPDVFFTNEIRDGVITLSETATDEKAAIINYIDNPPDGFLREDDGSIEIDKTVVAGEEETAVTDTFYFTLYGDEDLEDIIETRSLSLKDASRGTVLFEDLAYGTYYIAESDAKGNPVDDDFAYGVSISTDTVDIQDRETVTIEITNDLGGDDDGNKKKPDDGKDKTKTKPGLKATGKSSGSPKTGDTSQPIVYLIVLLGAAMVIAGIVVTRRKVIKPCKRY